MLEKAGIREHNEYASIAQLHDKKVEFQSYDTSNSWDNIKKNDLSPEKNADNMKKMMQENQNALKR